MLRSVHEPYSDASVVPDHVFSREGHDEYADTSQDPEVALDAHSEPVFVSNSQTNNTDSTEDVTVAPAAADTNAPTDAEQDLSTQTEADATPEETPSQQGSATTKTDTSVGSQEASAETHQLDAEEVVTETATTDETSKSSQEETSKSSQANSADDEAPTPSAVGVTEKKGEGASSAAIGDDAGQKEKKETPSSRGVVSGGSLKVSTSDRDDKSSQATSTGKSSQGVPTGGVKDVKPGGGLQRQNAASMTAAMMRDVGIDRKGQAKPSQVNAVGRDSHPSSALESGQEDDSAPARALPRRATTGSRPSAETAATK